MTRLHLRLALALSLAAACLPSPGGAHAAPRGSWSTVVRATHYWATGYPMASGYFPFVGAVACDSSIGLYATVVTADGARWQCLDTGLLDGWGYHRVDFFGFDVEAVYGAWPTVTVEN